MGKRRFAGTLSASDHSTENSKYTSNVLTAWIRGWDVGVEVIASASGPDQDSFEIWACGGSHARSNGRKLIGTLVEGVGFIPSNDMIVEEQLRRMG